MSIPSVYLALCLVHLVAVMSPGPGFFIALTNALSGGFRVGIATALGIASADLALLLLSVFGTSLLIANFPSAMTWIQIAGAVYLIYIGFKGLRSFFVGWHSRLQARSTKTLRTVTAFKGFQSGFFTTILNPKAIVYFISLTSQTIKADQDVAFRLFVAGSLIFITFFWFSFVAVLAGQKKVRNYVLNYQYVLDGIMGIVLVIFGCYLI